MNKYFIILSLTACCFGCGNNTETGSDVKKDSARSETSVMDNPDYEKGLNLVAKSDCFTCHKLRDQSTGPAYGAVAAKYENTEANVNMLADKVIKGGSGVWGQVPMVQHPQITKEDAVSMVKYILLLKEEKK